MRRKTNASAPNFGPRRHWVAYCALGGGVFLFFLPALLGGLIPFSMDTAMQFYPVRYAAARLLANGEVPFWNRACFLGTPLLANPQWGLLYPFHWLFLLRPTGGAFLFDYPLHILIGALGCYRLTLEISRRRAAAFASAAFLIGGSYTWAHLPFGAFLNATAWIPWTIWGLVRFVRTGRWQHLLGCAIFWSLQLLAGAPQIAWYAALNYGLLAVLLVAMPPRAGAATAPDMRSGWLGQRMAGRLGPLWAVLLFGLLGACFAAPQLAPTAAFVQACDRAGGLQWPEVESGTLPMWYFLKVFLGGTGQGWEDCETTCTFTGLGLFFVLFSAIRFRRNLWVRCLWILLAADIAFCNQTVGRMLYRFFPLYAGFHDPKRILCMVQVCMAVLGGVGVQAFVDFLAMRAPRLALRGPGRSRVLRAVATLFTAGGAAFAAFWNWADPLPADWRNVFVGWEAVCNPHPVFLGASFLCLLTAWGLLFRLAALPGAGRRPLGARRAVRWAVVLLGAGVGMASLAFASRHVDTKVASPARLRSPVAEKLQDILASSPAPRFLTLDLTGRYSGDYQRASAADLMLPDLSCLYGLRDVQGYDPFIPLAYARWLDRINGTPERPYRRHYGIVSPPAALSARPVPWGAIVTQKELPAVAKDRMGAAPRGEILAGSDDGSVILIKPANQIPYVLILRSSGQKVVPQPQVTWTLSANHFRATVPPHADPCVLQVYETPLDGWRARVAGQRVGLLPDLLTDVPLAPSSVAQEVRLDYWPPYFTEGILLSPAALLGFVLAVRTGAFGRRRKAEGNRQIPKG